MIKAPSCSIFHFHGHKSMQNQGFQGAVAEFRATASGKFPKLDRLLGPEFISCFLSQHGPPRNGNCSNGNGVIKTFR